MNDTTLPAGFGERWVNTMFAAFLDRTEALADLDRRAGDGDFGANIAAALRRARTNIDTEPPVSYGAWLTAVSRGFLGTGGTSGPLFGMFFRELARCTSDSEPSLADFSGGLSAGLATVQRYGNAEVGHKTMVDALAPAAETLAARVAAGSDPGEALDATADAAVQGAAGTASLVAKRGRASYVGEVARGVLDPGAAAAALILQTAAAACADRSGDIDTGWLDTA
ncbi:dihydroxyacetone kinase subunit DhaL [Nocardia carnea]|uniref:Dihydroxyacetone kinase subunit DhaL n=1 Tax=Nocardia carnea TaxID=37328 RepID=A0ABW7TM95_9NOCA|nr:dihydroxyacetone kinase subunit DhaL [Nocardia carnea]